MYQENAQTHVCRTRGEAYEALISAIDGLTDVAGCSNFCDNPEEYEWRYVEKREMIIPYNCDALPARSQNILMESEFPDLSSIRWEKHRVWIVEGILRPGESNLLVRRRFYIDEDSWLILLGEGYDGAGTMARCFMLYTLSIPSKHRQGRWYSFGSQGTRPEPETDTGKGAPYSPRGKSAGGG
jgi:hypothetical protein